jgi:ComF family protein
MLNVYAFSRQLSAAGKFLLDAIAPLRCLGCNRIGVMACEKCLSQVKIELTSLPGPVPIQANLAVADFKQPLVQKLIHAFKYDSVYAAGQVLGKWLSQELNAIIQPDDEILPVPLHSARKRGRGFNQSEFLAKILSEKFKVTLNTNLKRVRNTKPQVECSGEERKVNLKNAFKFTNKTPARRFVLIDDVTTTGSTFLECAKAIRKTSSVPILAIAVARG